VDRLTETMEVAARALGTLEELARLSDPTAVERDAAIQRFEYTFECIWKFAQRYLRDVEKVSAGSPRAVIRACRDIGLLSDEQAVAALRMGDDRNLTSHTYNERLARELMARVPIHADLLTALLAGLRARVVGLAGS
jgi:nucleotidyltransferase substrate binding protein (TIGR01987 family)